MIPLIVFTHPLDNPEKQGSQSRQINRRNSCQTEALRLQVLQGFSSSFNQLSKTYTFHAANIASFSEISKKKAKNVSY